MWRIELRLVVKKLMLQIYKIIPRLRRIEGFGVLAQFQLKFLKTDLGSLTEGCNRLCVPPRPLRLYFLCLAISRIPQRYKPRRPQRAQRVAGALRTSLRDRRSASFSVLFSLRGRYEDSETATNPHQTEPVPVLALRFVF